MMPPADEYPTGDDLVNRYLEPLAGTPELAPHLRLNTRVIAVAKDSRDRMKDAAREDAAFVVRVQTTDAEETDIFARGLIDASGTIEKPGALGASGLPAIGEQSVAQFIRYGMPDILGEEHGRYAGRRVLDPAVESPRARAPLIDPNVHSCGTVPPHGAEELKQPDANLFVIGMKSYGRAPTFLMLTGYEQARSAVTAIAGDWEAARRVELVLPETGVCSTDLSDAAIPCCGTAAPEPVAVPVGALTTRTKSAAAERSAGPQSSCC
jgi:hypothetical protein